MTKKTQVGLIFGGNSSEYEVSITSAGNIYKEIDKDNIVKGIEWGDGEYVILSPEEIASAYPKTTQTIEIETFVPANGIPFVYLERPYYVAPINRGAKVYALLRETLSKTNKVALAPVVLHTRQHLAALMPLESAMVLVMLRWPAEVRSLDTLELGPEVTKPELAKGELDMAKRLVQDMSADWKPEDYRDSFEDKIMALVEKKANEGKIEDVETATGEEERKTADVIDLTELLKRSLGGKTAGKAKPAAKPAANKKATKTSRG